MLKTYTNSDTMEECNCVQLSFIGFVGSVLGVFAIQAAVCISLD